MSGIDIKLTAGFDRKSSSIEANGSVEHVITDKEVIAFGLYGENLKNAVNKHSDQSPRDVYLHRPTPWGDLYKSYGWEEVKTVLKVIKSEILDVTSKPTIVAKKNLINTSPYRATFDASVSEDVKNTTQTMWSKTDTIDVSQSFNYSLKFLGTGTEGTTTMSYSHSWGQGGSETQEVTVGSRQGVSVPLEPKQSAVAQLTASKGSMKVRIVYNASLTGSVAVNYGKKHNGHHFWSYDISQVMADASLNNSLEFTEEIEIGYYSNSTVKLEDGDQATTGESRSQAEGEGQNDEGEDQDDQEEGRGEGEDQGEGQDEGENQNDEGEDQNDEGEDQNNEGEGKGEGEQLDGGDTQEGGEFAEGTNKIRLVCNGRPCAQCFQCRDWHFDGDEETWTWISNYRKWNDEDEDRWYSDAVYECFTKRDDAMCKFSGYNNDAYSSNGYLLHGGYGVSHGNVYDHSCVCEKH
ncbi:unnamed protein product [Rotaria magnacalcarata]|uniref:Uncharacterized protein n=1 Tax=Rotaria magnacalcarata TaxID=392030 RepID=A0A816RPQ2_9BILA|nr:unnamed protein product [Rotaria magnacalcarata]CAF3800551.1 unnamed protein product [Rotaria magnacalcarata]